MSKKGLGTLASGDSYSQKNINLGEFKNTLRKALRLGLRDFDTAYSYQNAETILSSVFKEQNIQREDLFITTKVMPLLSFKEKAETSLKRLKMTYIDNLLIHWPTKDEKLLFKTLKSLEKLKEEEKILNIGLSNFPLSLIKSINKDFEINVIQRAVSLLWIKELEETISYCKNNKINIQAVSVLAGGLLKENQSSPYILDKKIYKKILADMKNLAIKKDCSPVNIAISFVEKFELDSIFLGCSKDFQLEENLLKIELTEAEFSDILKISKEMNDKVSYDNFYNHKW